VDLADVYLVCDLSGSLSTEASLFSFRVEELFSVGRSISNVEDISEHRGSWKLDPI